MDRNFNIYPTDPWAIVAEVIEECPECGPALQAMADLATVVPPPRQVEFKLCGTCRATVNARLEDTDGTPRR